MDNLKFILYNELEIIRCFARVYGHGLLRQFAIARVQNRASRKRDIYCISEQSVDFTQLGERYVYRKDAD
jgi:hypothetical protein